MSLCFFIPAVAPISIKAKANDGRVQIFAQCRMCAKSRTSNASIEHELDDRVSSIKASSSHSCLLSILDLNPVPVECSCLSGVPERSAPQHLDDYGI